ncbi:PVC-type heme-binding CxxCH protein [Membranihabitans maritimus]|uniref:PVC-type heme-binding CxxCH protein n=1 Tax=Membranihabitans maritimus TaxID=2904244 RepID=UPI001F248928|nr:PVC-type heme-binding CxxCH protein [Membranihabitans maritimus]
MVSNPHTKIIIVFLILISIFFTFLSCENSDDTSTAKHPYELLPDEEKHHSQNAISGLTVADDLNIQLFASEPMLVNPTNIDIDHRGRIWVCEAYNYRNWRTGKEPRKEGDRILILEDNDRDGKADTEKVFYQDPEINAPLGIWVMDNRVIISQSPYVWLLTDEDGDDKADKKEIIFQGISGEQHDHGIHAFVFGPDGKLYFNFGNEGKQLLDASGNPVKNKYGNVIDFEKYRQGMIFRCDPDFQNLEVMAHNFRNPYELAVDSYGSMWQSDNDDDGNRGTRINYVMDYGNYGFRDEITGANWRVPRTNMSDSIPFRHWHLNDPGVVPNLLQTWAGSPTGIILYEGDQLPERFRNQMIHCDAGPNVVRSYQVETNGAGFAASVNNIIKGTSDQWFRPSDVCAAPDGSLFISDWYDPGVGGHQVGDLQRGRIYRISAIGNQKYTIPEYDYSTIEGALEALKNPNLSVRYRAWNSLKRAGPEAISSLQSVFENANTNPRYRARSFWILCQTENVAEEIIPKALLDPNPNIRIAGLRAVRQFQPEKIASTVQQLSEDSNIQVLRECLVALHEISADKSKDLWVSLASKYNGEDRWYLEALGIAAKNKWDIIFPHWVQQNNISNNSPSEAERDIIWRARAEAALPFLTNLLTESSVALDERLRYFRALDFHPNSQAKLTELEKLAIKNQSNKEFISILLHHIDPSIAKNSHSIQKVINDQLSRTEGSQEFIDIVSRFDLKNNNSQLMEMALNANSPELKKNATEVLLRQGGLTLLAQKISPDNENQTLSLIQSTSEIENKNLSELYIQTAFDDRFPEEVRKSALKALGGSSSGQETALELLENGEVEGNLKLATVQGLSQSKNKAVLLKAAKYLDSDELASSSHPPMEELLQMEGDSEAGRFVFDQYCGLCHEDGSTGNDFGPKLSDIGNKLSREGQYTAIFYPSAGISFGYEGAEIQLKDGSTLNGIIVSETEDELIVKFPGGNQQTYKMTDVSEIKTMDLSMMPAGLQNTMETGDLVNLVEYLMSLKGE